jgi:hypothetical protein
MRVLGTKRQSLSTNYLSQLNDCDLVGFSFRLLRPARHYWRTLIRLRPSVAPVLMTMIATRAGRSPMYMHLPRLVRQAISCATTASAKHGNDQGGRVAP